MNLKKELLEILDSLKKQGVSRRQIEKDLKYRSYYLDQAVSTGGNEKLLQTLRIYAGAKNAGCPACVAKDKEILELKAQLALLKELLRDSSIKKNRHSA